MSAVVNEREVPPPPTTSDSRSFRRAFKDLSDGLRARELWALLGWQDIKQRYRRSVIGPFWITIATGVTASALALLWSGTGIDLPGLWPLLAACVVATIATTAFNACGENSGGALAPDRAAAHQRSRARRCRTR